MHNPNSVNHNPSLKKGPEAQGSTTFSRQGIQQMHFESKVIFSTRNLGHFPPRYHETLEGGRGRILCNGWDNMTGSQGLAWSRICLQHASTLRKPIETEGEYALPKQLLCLWSEKESIWLKNCWITKDNHRITHRTGKDHQGH